MDIYDESGVMVARSAHPIECERRPEADKLESDMMFYAFRYALGRMTYAVSDVSQYLIDHWHEIDANHQRLIHQEISEALTNNTAGHECDKERWRAVLVMPNARAQPEAVTSTSGVPEAMASVLEQEHAAAFLQSKREGERQAATIIQAYGDGRVAESTSTP